MLKPYLFVLALFLCYSMARKKPELWPLLLIGLLADPVRKLIPGNPVYISVLFLPVFSVIYYRWVHKFHAEGLLKYYPQFRGAASLFFFFLGLNFIRPLLVSIRYLPLAIYGALQYLLLIAGVQVGFHLINCEKDVMRFSRNLVLISVPFLVTVIFHYLGFDEQFPVLETMGMDGLDYVQWHAGDTLTMCNGVFRNPEPMGWFAMVGVISALYLLLKGKTNLLWKLFYATYSLFCVFCILLSGRRKFFLGIFVFFLLFVVLTFQINKKKMIGYLLVFLALCFVFIYSTKSNKEFELYLASGKSGFEATEGRLKENMLGSIFWAVRRDGFWGRGLGSASQGTRHLGGGIAAGPAIEAGAGKIFAELGVPGTITFIVLLLKCLASMYGIIRKKLLEKDQMITGIFLFAIILTHLISFFISHQVYGDPLVGILTGLYFGFLLAIVKFKKQEGPKNSC